MRDELDSTPDTDADEAFDVPATGTDVVRHERELALDADEAWELLGTSEGLERWLGDRVDLDIEPGAEGTITDGDEQLLTEVESVEPGRRVSLRWWSEERGAAVVDLTLEPVSDERTRLVVTEIPVRALEVPAVHTFAGGSSTGPTMLAGSRALALA
ncbi:MAG: SRPBCC domain-containing protein [Solirubrobacteraceae bacterium]|nr:SRPBCC domain-containing protein [Solirubrobacteraceae bacterium]